MSDNIKKILIFRIGQLGDSIIALPSIHAINQFYPEAHLTLLSDRHPDKEYVLADELLAPTRLLDDFISFEANAQGVSGRKMLAFLPELKRRGFDTLVYLVPRLRTRWQIWRDLTYFKAAGIKNIIGQYGIRALPQKNGNKSLPLVEHEADHLLSRLRKSGIPVPDSSKGCMDLHLSSEEIKRAAQFIELHVFAGRNSPLVGFGPGSKWRSKMWAKDRYAETGRVLISRHDIMPIVFGSSEEASLGDWLIAQWGKGVNAAGVLSVREAAAVLQYCNLYVGNDTGTMHLAVAVGTPCVAIFSSQDWPGRWYPYGNQNIVFRSTIACEGCMVHTCPKEGIECLDLISSSNVVNACQSLLHIKDKF